MQVFNTISGLQLELLKVIENNKTIGFVPTMGALHEGHISLVKESEKTNDTTVVSIFVNPTQFNNSTDLEKYPRTIENDLSLLAEAGVDYVFVPSVDEIYPEKDERSFDFGLLDKVMEGKFRPGHFNGVAQVVSKLLDIVKPNRAYFGEKDFQQLAIISNLVQQNIIPVEIIAVPIKRETTGLALSSRNQRLTENQRLTATAIYKFLSESAKSYKNYTVEEALKNVIDGINSIDGLEVEYFEIIDGFTLQPVSNWSDSEYVVGCITVYCGDVRLIDNITYIKKD